MGGDWAGLGPVSCPGCRLLPRELWLTLPPHLTPFPWTGPLSLAVGFGEPTVSSKARQESVFKVDDCGSYLIIR